MTTTTTPVRAARQDKQAKPVLIAFGLVLIFVGVAGLILGFVG